MRGAVMHGPGEVRVEEREAPQIVEPTDAIIRVSAACVCGSDLWPYRGIGVEDSMWPMPMGHEYAGIVEEVGDDVTTVKPGQFVVGSFWASDNTCEICRAGYQSACVNRVPMGALGAQAELLRVPLGRRHADRHPGHPVRRPRPEPAGGLRRPRHRLVRRRRRRGRPGQDRRRRRRRRGRAARRARGQAARRRADHRHEPPRVPAAPGARVRRHRHRRASAATKASPRSRSSPTGSAPTRWSRRSARRSR